ncbi:MAG: hypothetical protein SPK49_08170 [Erysipelotrichaceae bacterium]|nr:hypothetical protein [Erysipelotrichaceae bacterium]
MSSRYTEDWVPVRDIVNGTILLENKLSVTGVKIMPRNIFILDEQSQANILTGLKNFYNQIDFEFWLVCADRPVDITVYLSQLQLLYNQTQHPAIRKLIREDIDKGNAFVNNSVVDTEYYILFKEKNSDLIQKKIRLLINGLSGCGLVASQTTNEDLRVILDNFLNGGVTTEFGTVVAL